MKKYTILVVDDEPDNFEVIETLLGNDDNYQLYYASNGLEALANIDTFNPDVILLDLMMPEMDGLEVCQRLKLMRKWRATPIIMVTANTGKEVLLQCFEAGANDFINKPVDSIELRARVRSMIGIKKQFDRIESLSKLQQHNITSLENSLGELVGDLAIGFVNELSAPLTSIQEQLEELHANLDNYSKTQSRYLVALASKSATNIQKSTYKFWTYLDFAVEKKQFDRDKSCNFKEIVKQISIVQAQWLHREQDLSFELEDAKIAVDSKHCELIVKELLDNVFKFSEAGTEIEICGRVIEKSFHFWIGDKRADGPIGRPLANSNVEEQELGLGLKVVKKIVDMYDGCFVTNVNDRHETIVYLTLPLSLTAG